MTIKELYEMAVKQGIENYELRVHYSDDGGFYAGSRPVHSWDIETNKNKEIIDL